MRFYRICKRSSFIPEKIIVTLSIITVLCLLSIPCTIYAAEASVTFGSNWYEEENEQTFPVGVYINSDSRIGKFYVELKYDHMRLSYVSGADRVSEEDGVLILEGEPNASRLKYRLKFKAVSGGEAFVEIINAEIEPANTTNDDVCIITDMGKAPVYLGGDDTAQIEIDRLEALRLEEERKAEELEKKRLEELEKKKQEEESKQAEELSNESETTERFTFEIIENDKEEEKAIEDFLKEYKKEIVFLLILLLLIICVLAVVIILYANQNKLKRIRKMNRLKRLRKKKKKMKSKIGKKPQPVIEPVSDITTDNKTHTAIDTIPKITAIKQNKTSTELASKTIIEKEGHISTELVQEQTLEQEEQVSTEEVSELTAKKEEQTSNEATPEPKAQNNIVIHVDDVSMQYKVSTSNVSGLKEYVIQRVKRQITYRTFMALKNIDFDVYQGEIVGIIGTNGSGKSTLLKIISGALKPTSGRVDVDTRKIQLLTLGTGFDMELTARENVYLNGSIIGYKKEFIDEHFDSIVEFAELQDFMDEKVKNFSSGMVSRLGFAIATVGDAAEILILDEVLSVGDEFFRKKSLKRVKEMIHGGSTVLMVSHGMGTILENCTKVVWIEKGELRMIGEPKVVCEAYRKMSG